MASAAPATDIAALSPEIIGTDQPRNVITQIIPNTLNRDGDVEKMQPVAKMNSTYSASSITDGSLRARRFQLLIVLIFGCIIMPGSILSLLCSWFFPRLHGEETVKVVGGIALVSLVLLEWYFSFAYVVSYKRKDREGARAVAFSVWAGFTGITFCVMLTSMIFVSALVKPQVQAQKETVAP